MSQLSKLTETQLVKLLRIHGESTPDFDFSKAVNVIEADCYNGSVIFSDGLDGIDQFIAEAFEDSDAPVEHVENLRSVLRDLLSAEMQAPAAAAASAPAKKVRRVKKPVAAAAAAVETPAAFAPAPAQQSQSRPVYSDPLAPPPPRPVDPLAPPPPRPGAAAAAAATATSTSTSPTVAPYAGPVVSRSAVAAEQRRLQAQQQQQHLERACTVVSGNEQTARTQLLGSETNEFSHIRAERTRQEAIAKQREKKALLACAKEQKEFAAGEKTERQSIAQSESDKRQALKAMQLAAPGALFKAVAVLRDAGRVRAALAAHGIASERGAFEIVDGKPAVDGVPAIVCAAALGEVKIVEILRDAGCDLNAVEPSAGRSAAFCAAVKGHAAVIDALALGGKSSSDEEDLDDYSASGSDNDSDAGGAAAARATASRSSSKRPRRRVDFNLGRTDNDATPAFAASQKGHLAVLQALHATGRVDFGKLTKAGASCLHAAAAASHLDCVRFLVQTVKLDTSLRCGDQTAAQMTKPGQKDILALLSPVERLFTAVEDNDSTVVVNVIKSEFATPALLQRLVKEERERPHDFRRGTGAQLWKFDVFTYMGVLGRSGIIAKLLLDEMLPVTVAPLALNGAAMGGHTKVMTSLLDAGCPVDGFWPKQLEQPPPLHCAASSSQLAALKLLLERKANPNSATTNPNYGPVHLGPVPALVCGMLTATVCGDKERKSGEECLRALLRAGATVKAEVLALFMIMTPRTRAAKQLDKSKSIPRTSPVSTYDLIFKEIQSLPHIAAKFEMSDEPDPDQRGGTLLHRLIAHGHAELVDPLIGVAKRMAQPGFGVATVVNALDGNGRTPLRLAMHLGGDGLDATRYMLMHPEVDVKGIMDVACEMPHPETVMHLCNRADCTKADCERGLEKIKKRGDVGMFPMMRQWLRERLAKF